MFSTMQQTHVHASKPTHTLRLSDLLSLFPWLRKPNCTDVSFSSSMSRSLFVKTEFPFYMTYFLKKQYVAAVV